ncbi:hypothetical protein CDJ04_08080 [Salmonella enterica]|uniref:Uncharacterized protein n=1 Tax=Salmonella enterica TaxID=28901 RepID=A0A633DG81_SALER|nr:hypothetical protein [Salmonella enterica]EBU8698006.1 hypothetical protein [Salmonella enterica subsp. enterica serovar Kokomlemle]EBW2601993.1 hypothetical protein [Salmonella enterica subsp. enterica serovar Poano]EBZ5139207.1 hypothetical protein [Salmonella enterica subsp. enterica serovar Antsalova]ECE6543571.1 hypothetical protein [Salmonella enterica subsp. enterica]EHI8598809.1 hypothetical protein [Salmonella enterica subsp. enterica serovar 51:z:1,5]
MREFVALLWKLFLLLLITYVTTKLFKPMTHPDVLTTAGVLSTISGILFGFVLAAISIFSSASGGEEGVINALKRNNIIPVIIKRLLSTGITLIVACIFPLIAMFLSAEIIVFGKPIDYLFILLGLSSLLISLFTFIRCWCLLRNIFPHL